MARIEGAPAKGLMRRIAYWYSRRVVGKVVTPLAITAHHPRLLWGYGQFEQSLQAAKKVAAPLKAMVQIRVATRVGCPF